MIGETVADLVCQHQSLPLVADRHEKPFPGPNAGHDGNTAYETLLLLTPAETQNWAMFPVDLVFTY